MKFPFVSLPFRRAPWLLLGLAAPLLLTQCKSTASYKDIEYSPAKLKTPPGHGLEKKEYPFDDDGRYRKEWVRNNTRGRTRSSHTNPHPEPEGATSAAGSDTGSGDYPNYQELASATVPAGTGGSASTETRYHRVASGDTLYSLANRYGTSVDALKGANGLTSNSIRTGQTLRVP